MKKLKRLCKRIFGCQHNYMPYQSMRDGNRMRTLWKCTRCGKEKMGK